MALEPTEYGDGSSKLIRVEKSILEQIDKWWAVKTKDGVYNQMEWPREFSWRQMHGWTGRLQLLLQEVQRLEGSKARGKRGARAS